MEGWSARTRIYARERDDSQADGGGAGLGAQDTGDGAAQREHADEAANDAQMPETREAPDEAPETDGKESAGHLGTTEEEDPRAEEANGVDVADGAVAGVTRVGFAAISRVDAARREVEFCATSEAVDSYGTVFDYAASKDAFTRWIGNVREMHERRAVGSRVGVRCDDAERKIYVRVRISRGARDTWEKICDGTLRGASIGAANVIWERQTRAVSGGQRLLRVATRYDLAELSLVDNPSNPDALGLSLVRDAVPDARLLDELTPPPDGRGEQTAPPNALPNAAAQRDGTRPTAFLGQGPAGNARARLHAAARGILQGCGCARCAVALAVLGEGEDGAHPAASGAAAGDERYREGGEGEEPAQMVARVAGAQLAASAALVERLEVELTRLACRMEEQLERLPDATHWGAVAQVERMGERVRAIGERVEALEAQPLPGGPVARATGRPVEKTHALSPGGHEGATQRAGEEFRALEALAGRLHDPQAQMAVAAELIRLQRGEG